MLDGDRVGFVAILVGLAAMKPGGEAKLTRESLDLWWNAMRDWPLEDFRAAANHLVTSVEFMPSPFHFAQLRKAGRPTAGEAWIKAVKSCTTARIPGGHSGGTSGDPLIDQVVQAIGGYGAIAMCDLDKLPFMERRFCEHYAELAGADETRAAVPQITVNEARNALGRIRARLAQ